MMSQDLGKGKPSTEQLKDRPKILMKKERFWSIRPEWSIDGLI